MDAIDQSRLASTFIEDPEVQLWEVLVPCQFNDGRPVRTRYHRIWDAKVRAISGGLTILKPAIGHWVSPEGSLFKERMIPVRIACTRAQALEIAEMTACHYDQEATFAHLVSTEVLVHKRVGKSARETGALGKPAPKRKVRSGPPRRKYKPSDAVGFGLGEEAY
jgi:hypothetical protein